ncbi:unnamed protein product [Brassica oleracea var. botrytis]
MPQQIRPVGPGQCSTILLSPHGSQALATELDVQLFD